jgi:hypothetical protein
VVEEVAPPVRALHFVPGGATDLGLSHRHWGLTNNLCGSSSSSSTAAAAAEAAATAAAERDDTEMPGIQH